ncbi:MAG: hypothetical protein BJ554DRAFT_6021, partial [Olpidium bornovanus]
KKKKQKKPENDYPWTAARSRVDKLPEDPEGPGESRRITATAGFPASREREFGNLAHDANVYKLVGPVLVKQDKPEAASNVDKRIDYITAEIKRVEGQLKDLTDKSEKAKTQCQLVTKKIRRDPWSPKYVNDSVSLLPRVKGGAEFVPESPRLWEPDWVLPRVSRGPHVWYNPPTSRMIPASDTAGCPLHKLLCTAVRMDRNQRPVRQIENITPEDVSPAASHLPPSAKRYLAFSGKMLYH